MYSWSSIRSHSSLRLFPQMKRLRPVMRQMLYKTHLHQLYSSQTPIFELKNLQVDTFEHPCQPSGFYLFGRLVSV